MENSESVIPLEENGFAYNWHNMTIQLRNGVAQLNLPPDGNLRSINIFRQFDSLGNFKLTARSYAAGIF